MNTEKQPKSGNELPKEAARKSNGVTMVTCFAILWAVCCLCLLLQSFLLDQRTYIPQEAISAKQPEDLVNTAASRTIYAAFSFSTETSAQQVPVDTCLIRQDEKYTENTARRLLDYKVAVQRDHKSNIMNFIRSALLSAAILICFGACLNCLKNNFFTRSSRITLCVIFVFFHTLMLVIVKHAFLQNSLGTSFHLYILLPLALFPSLGAYLLGLRFGICISMLLATLTPVFVGGESPYTVFVYSIISSFSGIVLFHNVSKRKGFLLGGLSISAILLLISVFFLWQNPIEGVWEEWNTLVHTFCNQGVKTEWPHFWIRLATMALANGFFVMIGLFVLPTFCERFFDVITPIALHELSATDHPLLSRLNNDAKGTYNHSVQVGQFAYDAAQAIGADKLLAKVCGYFHDVGKLKNPEYFIENLLEGQHNPHTDLTPVESCAKIREHVIYGGELARKYKLQRPIAEAIVSHHGTDVISYFYHKACLEAEQNGTSMPDRQDFSYSGPLPHRKEAVIVEIADICEAASRAELQKWDHVEFIKVRDFIDKLIANKMKNRQFDEADLTIGELNVVCDVIASSICRLYHGRPQYAQPQDDEPPHPLAIERGSLSSIDLREVIHPSETLDNDDKQPDMPSSAPQPEQEQQPPSQEQDKQADGSAPQTETQPSDAPSADEHEPR